MTVPLLEGRNIHAAFGSRKVLDGVSVQVKPGEVLGLLGANGAGKSTLLRILAGLYTPQTGEVKLEGAALADHAHPAQTLAYLDQSLLCHWPLSVERLVGLGRLPHLNFGRRFGEKDRHAVEQAMEDANVTHLRDRQVTTLSGGEQARVFLARALAVEPKTLLVDEPVAGLDPAHQLVVMELLKARAKAGMGVICVLHDLTLAARFCDRLALVHEGRLTANGVPEEVLTREHLAEALQVEAVIGSHNGEPYVIPWSHR
ncbi:MAG: ABC transporter ATP-binding protein [Rickettsiales bacterium]